MSSYLSSYYSNARMNFQTITSGIHESKIRGEVFEEVVIKPIKVAGHLQDIRSFDFRFSYLTASGHPISLSNIKIPEKFIAQCERYGFNQIKLLKKRDSLDVVVSAQKTSLLKSSKWQNDLLYLENSHRLDLNTPDSHVKLVSKFVRNEFYKDYYLSNPNVVKVLNNDFAQSNSDAINFHLEQLSHILSDAKPDHLALDGFKNILRNPALLKGLNQNNVEIFYTEWLELTLNHNDQKQIHELLNTMQSILFSPSATPEQMHLIETIVGFLSKNLDTLSFDNKMMYSFVRNVDTLHNLMTNNVEQTREQFLLKKLLIIQNSLKKGMLLTNHVSFLIICIHNFDHLNAQQKSLISKILKQMASQHDLQFPAEDHYMKTLTDHVILDLNINISLLKLYLPIINELDKKILDATPEHFEEMKYIKTKVKEILQYSMHQNDSDRINDLLKFIQPNDLFDYHKLSSFKREMLDYLVQHHNDLPQESQLLLQNIKVDQVRGLILNEKDAQIESLFKTLKRKLENNEMPFADVERSQLNVCEQLRRSLSFVNQKYFDELMTQLIASDCRSQNFDGIQSHFNRVHNLLAIAARSRSGGDLDFSDSNNAVVSRAKFYVAALDVHNQILSQVFKNQLDQFIKINNLMGLPVYSA